MGEIMTSRLEAKKLQFALRETVKDLVREGWTKGQIGSAMAGIGLALVQAHNGSKTALGIVESVRDALAADNVTRQ